jgi:GTP cyclohydrolase IB
MQEEKRFLVDVGMTNLPFPMKVVSKKDPDGQATVAGISISARVMQEFEARFIDKFIEIIHSHRDRIGTKTLKTNILDYLKELQANTVQVDFKYPYFIEKLTPVSKEKCLVKYNCTYSVKVSSLDDKPKVLFKMEIPAITTYPMTFNKEQGGLLGQLSSVFIEIESEKDVYPEDLLDIVDKHALVPVYSFLTEKDQEYVIKKIHSERKTSVVMTDEIRNELSHDKSITWYSVKCANFGMLHSYSTVIGTEKSMWVPFSSY